MGRGNLVIRGLESLLVDSELNGLSSSLGTEVVHARLETHLPAGKVHAGDLAHGGLAHVNVEGLGLINEGTTVGSHLNNGPLRDFPNGLVEGLDVLGNAGNVLDRATFGNDAVLHVVGPETHLYEIPEKPRVDDLELAGEHTSLVDVGGIRLEALVVAENLRGGSSGHRSKQQTVANTVFLYVLLEGSPIPEVGRSDVPHVVLEDALGDGRTLIGGVGALLLGKLAGGSKSGVVDGLEDLNVQLASLSRIEGHTESQESISKTLHTDTNRTVAHVAVVGFLDGVVVDVDDPVEVADDDLGDLVQPLEVVRGILVVDEGGKSERRKVANSDLIRSRVLNDLSAQVGAADGTEVLLVALAVAGILVEHEGVAGLGLGLEDGIPELLGLNSLASLAFPFVLFVQSLELVAVDIGKTRALVGAHESPGAVLLDTLHEQIGDPEGKEEIASAHLLLTVVLAEVEELEDIGVPRLKVDGESTRTLVATLVNIASGVVEDPEHGNDTVGRAVGTGDIGARGANAVNVETDTASHLGDHGASLEGVVDALDAVLLHIDQEARRELGLGSTGVEEGGRSVGEGLEGHEVVGLDNALDVVTPDTDSNTHDHVLGTLGDLAIELEKV